MQITSLFGLAKLSLTTSLLAFLFLLTPPKSWSAEWKGIYEDNPKGPGQQVEIRCEGKVVARFLYGTDQAKPFLHVYDREGKELTNGGLDDKGETTGQFPHHRGIFIGWKVRSNLGTYDLWHMTGGARMTLKEIETKTDPAGATILAQIQWLAGKKDVDGSNLLITETRRLRITQPGQGSTQVDAQFTLLPARDLKLDGDLQHSGVHFRTAEGINEKDSSYLFEPERAKGNDLKWCHLVFRLGDRWYAVQEMNAPSNPVEELSMRAYGRFGYFFHKELNKGEPLTLRYGFGIDEIATPEAAPKLSEAQKAAVLDRCRQRYEAFAEAAK